MTRSFVGESVLADGSLGMALAPALTPGGIAATPSFFHGFAVHPQVLARGLVTLAEVAATRYFRPVPTGFRDPVLSAQGDRLRAECFSACNGVYARLDLLAAGFDGGDIARGTTNVDIRPATRAALARVSRAQLLHLNVGLHGLTVSALEESAGERPVQMPDRWVRALGNAAELQHGLVPRVRVGRAAARAFVTELPAPTGKTRSGWLTATSTGIQVAAHPQADAVHVEGLHRLSALKRMLVHVEGLTVYGPADGEPGASLVAVDLPAARLTLGLTADSWRGFSGEGALLEALAEPAALDDADLLSIQLAFEPVIDVPSLARGAGIEESRARAALAVLAVSGRVGWDAHDQAWFHRELPDDPDRVEADNQRLVGARRLVEAAAVTAREPGVWMVASGEVVHRVRLDPSATDPIGQATCSCAWYLRHTGGRGPCKHVLAVQLRSQQ
jgi:hypothetical protein